ncbi:hypothetical protein [uncultured Alloprevotella sp.]|uniref:hypothetical protein n=1 Tax=uncultured Alloprevotella sp. TaxID=1283315 RepID=UPI002612A58F|nr:hypothetical protein [uncultured Alloprevotella sp.]
MYQNAASGDRLAAANHRLVAANHRLAGANNRLAGANNKDLNLRRTGVSLSARKNTDFSKREIRRLQRHGALYRLKLEQNVKNNISLQGLPTLGNLQ